MFLIKGGIFQMHFNQRLEISMGWLSEYSLRQVQLVP